LSVDDRSVAAHNHDYFEVFVVHTGTATHLTPDYRRPAVAGTVGILGPGEVHALAECRGLVLTNVYYLAEWLLHEVAGIADREHLRALFLEPALFSPNEGRVIPHVQLSTDELESVTHDFADLQRESRSGVPSSLYLRATLLKCMVVIARAYARDVPSPVSVLRDEAWSVMQECEKAVLASRPLDLDAVAGRFSITRDHLCRVFRGSTGMSPTAYFARRRVFSAASRLLDPSATVTGVAFELGYSDTAHLSRQFRRELKLSPREYRKQYRVGP